MAQQEASWQSFPVELKDKVFPSLQDSAAAAGKQKRRANNKIPNAVVNINPNPSPSNYWETRTPRPPSVPEWCEDDVQAANQPVEDEAFSAALIQPEPELRTVIPKFTDRVTCRSRYETTGYNELGKEMKKQIMCPRIDPSAPYRSIVLTIQENQLNNEVWMRGDPDRSATPKWANCLPDIMLNDEFKVISYLRALNVPLGPRVLEVIKKRCQYIPSDKRQLPIYKSDLIIVSSAQPPKKSQSIKSWSGPSNDVRYSGTSASSSQHDQSSVQYDRQTKASLEFTNSRFHQKGGGRGYQYRDARSNRSECGSSRSSHSQDWDFLCERPSKNNRYDDYGRKGEYFERPNSRSDCDYKEDSGYQEDGGDYDGGEVFYQKEEQQHTPSTPPPPIDKVKTSFSKKTPVWKIDVMERRGGRRGNPRDWRGRWTMERPILEDREVKGRSMEEQRDTESDARPYWYHPEVPNGFRRAFRCMEGITASSCTAFADDMHRVELLTWSCEQDGEEVAAKMREKYGIDEMEKEISERRINLALPRTTITLSVGAGGEADILFDGECTDVLVRGTNYEDVRGAITETVVKTHDFVTHSVPKFEGPCSSASKNTLITFGTPEESRAARERLREYDIDAKKIPRDLITGHWDGSYAKRECLLELEWERHCTYGFSVRFARLSEQNNLVDRIMRQKSDYFMSSHINIEEYYNRMFVSVPPSRYSVDDDLQFLKKVLEENGVELTGIVQLRGGSGPQTIENKTKQTHCKFAINRRMLKVAIDEGVWGGFHPRTGAEWQMMLDEARFSWLIEMQDELQSTRDRTNKATVHFDSYEQGERIAAQVQRMSPSASGDDRFILNKEDKKGVFARAKLRVHYNVPVLVRSLTLERLDKLDIAWRQQSNFNYSDFQTEKEPFMQWACLIADELEIVPPGYCRLIVEGFPRSFVEDSCRQLVEVIKGDVIKCNGDEGWLLTGVGRNMANIVAKEALERHNVLVDFNVLGKEIRLIGDRKNTDVVERRLRRIAMKGEAHIMDTLVTVGQPVYMNRTSKAIAFCGGLNMVQKVVGECRLSICTEDVDKFTLRFEGTVAAYERFRDFLGDLDDTLRYSAKAVYDRQRKTNPKMDDSALSPLASVLRCPICSCRPSSDFYRLEACGHVYCTACIYHQLHSELSSRTLPLACRHAGCDRKLAVSDILRLLLGRDLEEEGEIRGTEHLDEVKLRPLVTAIVTNALHTKRDRLIACRTADCAGIFPRMKKESDGLVRCKTCEKTACGACGYEPHGEYTCDEYEKLRDNVDVSIASYMKNKKVRKCPNESCSAVIEKTVGCNHMECVICRTHFCWLCCYASHTQGDIYAHMQNSHGGNGLHMDDGEMFMLQFDD